MKGKILTFIIGLILGAIITSGIFMYLNNGKKANGDFSPPDGTKQNGTRPEKPTGDMKNNKNSTTTDTTTDTTSDTE